MTTEIKVFYSTFPSLFQVVLSCFQVSALFVVFRCIPESDEVKLQSRVFIRTGVT